MSQFKRRDKLVCFRIAADEYEELERSCISTGSRSISDFARSAALARVRNVDVLQEGQLHPDAAAIRNRLAELDSLLRDISVRFGRMLGSGRPEV